MVSLRVLTQKTPLDSNKFVNSRIALTTHTTRAATIAALLRLLGLLRVEGAPTETPTAGQPTSAIHATTAPCGQWAIRV